MVARLFEFYDSITYVFDDRALKGNLGYETSRLKFLLYPHECSIWPAIRQKVCYWTIQMARNGACFSSVFLLYASGFEPAARMNTEYHRIPQIHIAMQ